jgi:tryptophan halogenase
MIQKGLTHLLNFFPDRDCAQVIADEYNRVAIGEYDRIRDFIILHYKATQRRGQPLWEYCGNMDIPEALAYKLAMFINSGRVVKYPGDLFAAPNWVAVFMGQDIWPLRYDPLIDQREVADVRANLESIRRSIRRAAEAAPRHEEYLAQRCHDDVCHG